MTTTLVKPSALGPQQTRQEIAEGSLPRNGRGQPYIIPREGGKPKAYTRCTTFIDCIDDKSNLEKWGKRMVLLGVAEQPGLLHEVRRQDPETKEGKDKLNGIAYRASAAAGAHKKRDKGTQLHGYSEHVDRGEPLPDDISPDDLADMMAYRMATLHFEIGHIERPTVHPTYPVAGTPDRTMFYDGMTPDGEPAGWMIGDLKTGSIYGALKMAMQLKTYSQSMLYNPGLYPVDTGDDKALKAWKKREFTADEAKKAYSPLGEINPNWGIIIHLPSGEAECTIYWIDLRPAELALEAATMVRRLRNEKDLLTSFF